MSEYVMDFGREFRDMISDVIDEFGGDFENLPADRKIFYLNRANRLFTDVWNAGYREGRAEGRIAEWP